MRVLAVRPLSAPPQSAMQHKGGKGTSKGERATEIAPGVVEWQVQPDHTQMVTMQLRQPGGEGRTQASDPVTTEPANPQGVSEPRNRRRFSGGSRGADPLGEYL